MTSAAGPEDRDIRDGDGFLYIANEIVVNIEDIDLVSEDLDQLGGERQRVDPLLNAYVAVYRMPDGVDIPRLVERFRSRPADKRPRIGPNHVMHGEQGPILWGQPKYHGGPGGDPWPAPPIPKPNIVGPARQVTVAVIDTGISSKAEKLGLLEGRFLPGGVHEIDDVYADPQTQRIAVMGGHGTMVAGIIARHAPKAVLLSIKVLDQAGITDDTTVMLGMEKARLAGAEIMNLSLGGPVQPGGPATAIDAFLTKVGPDIVVVAAAGNTSGPEPWFYPACDQRVVSVAALDTTQMPESPAPFSNTGDWISACAPGERVHSTYVAGFWEHGGYPPRKFEEEKEYASWSGTSFATPHVTAAIAYGVVPGKTPRTSADALLAPLKPRLPGYGVLVIPPISVVYVTPPPPP